MSNKYEIVTIRAPKDSGFTKSIEELAKRENRSKNNYILTVLIKHIEQKNKEYYEQMMQVQ